MPIVKELILENFYNYYGKVTYEFKEGMNIVVADNNGGKSKIFNAFRWILSDEVFDSDDRKYTFLKDPKNLFKIISDKAKFIAQKGDKINTSVTLKFENDFSNNDEGPKKFTIKKTIIAEKLKDDNPFSLHSWNIIIDKPKFIKTLGFNTTQILDPEKQQLVPRYLLPDALKPYFMFQGEEIAILVGSELTNAIRKITKINKFNYFENYINDIYDKTEKQLNTKKKQASQMQGEAEHAANEIESLKDKISSYSINLKELSENKEEKQENFENLHDKYIEAAKQHSIIQDIAIYESDLKNLVDKLDTTQRDYNQKFFNDKWLLEGLENRIDVFIQLRDNYLKNRSKVEENKFISNLPYNIPDVPSLDKMIRDRHCAVCDRSMENDSTALDHITKLRNRNKAEITKTEKANHIKVFLDELFKNTSDIPSENDICESKKQMKNKLTTFNEKIVETTNKISDFRDQQKLKDQDAVKILNDYNKCKSDLDKINLDIERRKVLLEGAQKQFDKEQKKLNSLVGIDSINPGYQQKVDILDDIKIAFSETKKQYFLDQANSLTQIINKNYEDLTRGNQTNPGKVEIEVNENYNFRAKIKNIDGGILTGQGSAFQRMKQLALLMGIVQVGKSQDYPLIADAPVSEMSPILTKNFFNCIPENFKQAIILVKDLIDDNNDNHEIKLNRLGIDIMENHYLKPRIYINNAIGREQLERETVNQLIFKG